MKYRKDLRTGNELSVLGLGCMRLPSSLGRIDQVKASAIFQAAIDGGINYFDTAYLYPGSEVALGAFLTKSGLRNKIYIATKLPLLMCHKTEDFEKFFNIQLERLNTDHIDYYFMHMLTSPTQWKTLCDLGIEEWIVEKKEQGKIDQVGFSFHGQRDDFPLILDAYDWDFCQIQYNYINTTYQAGTAGLKRAAKKDIPVIIMEPLLGGKLATGLPDEAIQAFKKADPTLSPAAWGLNWIWNQPEPTVVLSGMSTLKQLEENLKLADKAEIDMLSKETLATYDEAIEAFNASYRIPCTGCNYCMPCPSNVDIPACFAAYNTSYSMGRVAGISQYITGTAAMTKNPSFASNCIECKKCEIHCPQSIPISSSLKDVQKRLEPFWLKIGMSAARRFMG